MPGFSEKRIVISSLLLIAATLAFYNPIVHNQFIDFDSKNYLLANSHVQAGLTWATVKWSFTTLYLGNWHPLTWLSHALDCQLFQLNPVGHNYTSLLLHAANAVLLFLLLLRATGCYWRSLLVAALFGLHPINVESVAWIAERKNVLSTLFFLLALLAYDRYARTGRRSLYITVVAMFTLGLMAKPQIVTLPFVLLLWDYWPLGRIAIAAPGGTKPTSTPPSFWYLVWEKWPLFLLAAADSVLTVIAQREGNTVRTLAQVSFSARLENVVVSYARYLGKAFWPSSLAPMYPHPGNSLLLWQVAGAIALLLAITALVLHWRERRYLAMGWFWFLGTLVPVIGIITVGDQAMADRYAYVPLIGLFLAVVWSAGELASRDEVPAAGLAVPAILVLCTLGVLTHRQLSHWSDDETLWRYTLSVTERNYVAHNNLALALAKLGRPDEAIVEFRAGTALHQYPPIQLLGLASYEVQFGHPQEAIEECRAVLRTSTDPQMQAAAWAATGQARLEMHDYNQADDSYQKALRLNPEDPAALIGSGLLALRQGQFDVAVAQLEHAVKVDGSDVTAVLLSQAMRRAGRDADAESLSAQVQKVSRDPRQAQVTAAKFLSLAGLKPL